MVSFGAHCPLVLRVCAKFRPAQRVGIENLLRLLNSVARPVGIGQTQQVVGQIVVGSGAARSSRAAAGHAAREQEAAAHVRDAAAGGGLEVVQVEVVVGESGLDLVLAPDLAQVHVAGKLVVAEKERIGGVGVADGAEGAVKAQHRLAAIIRVRVRVDVRSRNLQCVQSVVAQ